MKCNKTSLKAGVNTELLQLQDTLEFKTYPIFKTKILGKNEKGVLIPISVFRTHQLI
jgi:hypothetical protein